MAAAGFGISRREVMPLPGTAVTAGNVTAGGVVAQDA